MRDFSLSYFIIFVIFLFLGRLLFSVGGKIGSGFVGEGRWESYKEWGRINWGLDLLYGRDFFFNFYNRVKNKKENCLKNYYLMWLEIWLSSSENVMLLQRSYVY